MAIGSVIFGLVIVALLGVCAWAAIHDVNEWKQFAAAHNCRVVGHMDSSTAVGPSLSGKGGVAVVFIPGKKGYQCDDGVTYWRSE
jgi:hypothetical protein